MIILFIEEIDMEKSDVSDLILPRKWEGYIIDPAFVLGNVVNKSNVLRHILKSGREV